MSCVCDIMYSKGNLASVLYTNVSIEERSTDDDCPDRAYKVGSKTYSAKKNTLTVKKLKKGKKYTFKVRAIASGYKSSAWVKKSIKIKK